jgi:hypothetical protein
MGYTSGPSEGVRIEFASLLQSTATIQIADVDSVDINFASNFVTKMEHVMVTLERETFQYLQSKMVRSLLLGFL